MRFNYVNAGAPACVGDAGLFTQCHLNWNIEGGVITERDVPLYFDNGEMKAIMPYQLGDVAFPLGVHILKVIDLPPPEGSAEAEFNKRILLARRVIERAFGRLKGRWVFCKRSAFWNNIDFICEAIEACYLLHNFLEERAVEMSGEEDEVDDVGLAMSDELEDGQETRGCFCSGFQNT
jgi:hypothetical protein